MGFSMDNFLRINDVPMDSPTPKPKPAPPKPPSSADAPVDGSDRKLYARAAEGTGDKKILTDFDAALKAQHEAPPSPATAGPEPKPHVKPERAEDPSDQKFYNMAADRQNEIIDLENRAASLNHDIEALGTSSPSVTGAMQDELDEVEEDLARRAPKPSSPPATADADTSGHLQPLRAEDPSDQKFYNMLADRQNKIIDLEKEAYSLRRNIDALGTSGGYATQKMAEELATIEGELDRLKPDVTGAGDLDGTFTRNVRTPFFVSGDGDTERGQAAITRTLDDTGNPEQIQRDEFEIIQHGNGAYTVVLPGVIDLSSPNLGFDPVSASVRDVDQNAVRSAESALIDDNAYAEMVRDYIRANLPQGADVMLVGHSYGGDTALDLASDPTFNNADTGVNITHVVSAGYYSQPQIDHVQDHTQVLVLQNRQDRAVQVEGVGHGIMSLPDVGISDVRDYAGSVPGNALDYGLDTVRDIPSGANELFGLGASLLRGDVGDAVDHGQAVADGIVDNGSPLPVPGRFTEPFGPSGVTHPNDHTILARFDSGTSNPKGEFDAGHGQAHYIGFVDDTNDPTIKAFYDSVAQQGYTDSGYAYAVDVSVPEGDRSVDYPGRSIVDRGIGIWNSIPGNDFVEGTAGFLATDGLQFSTGKINEVRDAVTGDDPVGDLVDAVPYRNSLSAAGQALIGRDQINLDNDAINQIVNDPAFIARERAIVDAVQAKPGYGEAPLSIPLAELDGISPRLELGGERGQGSMFDQALHAFDLTDPDIRATWSVAGDDLTWLLRHASVDGTAHVAADGTITIDYEVSDKLDLRPGEGRSGAYNAITAVTGTIWHDVLGAEEATISGNFTTTPTVTG